MDQERFDRIAAALGGAATRRAGLRAALALFTGIGAGAALAADAGAGGRSGSGSTKPGRARDGEVDEEKRPCGPKAKDNACKMDKDCCTKHCKKPKRPGGKGRCRCIRPHKKCKKGQTCCGGATCKHKKCTPPVTCGVVGVACGSVAPCCEGLTCTNGSCAAPVVCTVCPSCAYQTVQAAIDALQGGATAGTVYIDAGDYSEDLTVTGKIHLTNCNGSVVTLRNATATSARSRTIVASSPTSELTISDITISGKTPLDATYGGGGIEAAGTLILNGTATVKDCGSGEAHGGGVSIGDNGTMTMNGFSAVKDNVAGNASAGGVAKGGDIALGTNSQLTMNDDSSVTGNSGVDTYGGGVAANKTGGAIVMNDRSAISNNHSVGGGAGVFLYRVSTLTMNDDSAISNNLTDYFGGALFADGDKTVFDQVVMHGNSTVSGNSAPNGRGGGLHIWGNGNVVMDGSSSIKNNSQGGTTLADGGGGVYVLAYGTGSDPASMYPTVSLSGSATITGNTGVKGGGVFGANSGGSSPDIVGGAGITGNTPSTQQCEGTQKPTCV